MAFLSNIALALLVMVVMISPAECDVRCELFDVDVQFEQDLPPGLARHSHRVHCKPQGSEETFEVTDLPPGFSVSRNPFVDIIGAVISRETAKVLQPPGSYISALKRPAGDRRSSLRRAATGDRTVLVVRVNAADSSTSATRSRLSDSIFGTSGDPVNLKSQYAACSDNQLHFIPFSGTTTTGVSVQDGVAEVAISESVSGGDDGVIRNAVTSAVAAKYGSTSQWDHLMYCLPPGTTGSWIAYAYINSRISVYNDEWCTYVSGQMHEIGHNLNLAHSNEDGNSYEDQTGMMGYSYSADDGPAMCFNNAKNWQLGWFEGCYGTVEPAAVGASTLLVGAAEYSTATRCGSEEAVVLKVPARDGGFYFVGYNKKVGVNAGTVEAGNEVTVQKTTTDVGYTQSDLAAKVGVGGQALLDGVYIKFCSLVGGKALVGVGTNDNLCLPLLCGNGMLDDGEACDDGNTVSNDGCSSTCEVELVEFCGDGIVNGGEACDDGNTVSNDGCSSTCVVEACGDGIVSGLETCDDGNTFSNDGCSSDCVVEVCGDGIVNNGETCDDGNTVSTDGCSSTCVLEACGDGILTSDTESCDDGNSVSNDGCSNTCVVEVCGDGIVNNGEECDGAAGTPPMCSDGCSGIVTCGSNCRWNSAVCADGICDATEALSACPASSNTCGDCVRSMESSCGDGVCDISLDAFGRAMEDSVNCNVNNGGDCQGNTGGKPNHRFYCGNDKNGIFVGCNDPRCTDCQAVPDQTACCGDGVCEVDAGETAANCEADCVSECSSADDCDDGLFCTVDTCTGGVCVHGSDRCESGSTCNEATETCDSAELLDCSVSADFPNCCCDNSRSQLGGKKQRRTCYDSGVLYAFGERCPAKGAAASVSGHEKDAGEVFANSTSDSGLSPTNTALLGVGATLSAVIIVLAIMISIRAAVSVRQRRQQQPSLVIALPSAGNELKAEFFHAVDLESAAGGRTVTVCLGGQLE